MSMPNAERGPIFFASETKPTDGRHAIFRAKLRSLLGLSRTSRDLDQLNILSSVDKLVKANHSLAVQQVVDSSSGPSTLGLMAGKNLTSAQALHCLLRGWGIKREAWQGNVYLIHNKGQAFNGVDFKQYLSRICVNTTGSQIQQSAYTLTHEDLFATDWIRLPAGHHARHFSSNNLGRNAKGSDNHA